MKVASISIKYLINEKGIANTEEKTPIELEKEESSLKKTRELVVIKKSVSPVESNLGSEKNNVNNYKLDFLKKIIDEDEMPSFVSDDTIVFDVCSLDETTLINRIFNSYKVHVTEANLFLELPHLIELIYKNSGVKA